jgi:hypothetical protein
VAKKMKLLIGLLVLGVVLLGVGTLFLLHSPQQTGTKIKLTPPPGNYLFNSENKSSDVLLKSVEIEKSVSDKQYPSVWKLPAVKAGESILIVKGSIQNNHPTNKEILMYAEGRDKTGKQVAWTLDAAGIVGQLGLHLETGETDQFTLHLNFAENIKSIRIFANNYDITPP